MSETLCTLRGTGGGGGRYTETSLWTNQSPSSSFANQNVSLSDSVSNYKYIKIRYNYSSSYSTTEVSGIISVDDLKKTTAGNRRVTLGLGQATAGNSYYARYVNYVSDTSLNITNVNAGSSGSTDIIPLEILGLNELKPGTDVGLVTNGASFSAKTSVTINCKVGDYIALGYARSASGYNVYWNGTVAYQSSDYVTGYTLSTNNFMYIMKASQTSNTFSVASGATVTGGYQIFSLG